MQHIYIEKETALFGGKRTIRPSYETATHRIALSAQLPLFQSRNQDACPNAFASIFVLFYIYI